MKIYNPPPAPENIIRCQIKDKKTKLTHNISFTDVTLAMAFNNIKALIKENISESSLYSCNIQLREFNNHVAGQSVSFNHKCSAIDVVYFLRKMYEGD